MNHFLYNPAEGGYINRFLTAGTFCRPGEYAKATLSGTVNEWLEKGFAIYENPCRREMIGERTGAVPAYVDLSECGPEDEVEVFGQKKRPRLYFPFGSQGVDFSEFYFNPTYLRTYCYTGLFAPEEETAEFEILTCGGVTLWVNGRLAEDFIPFTRNMVKCKRVSAKLTQGMNKIVVCLDDLAERDTDYYFRLRYLGGQKLKICIPAREQVDVEEVDLLEGMLKDMAFEREAYVGGPVRLSLNNPLEREVDVEAVYKPVADKIARSETLVRRRQYRLPVGAESLRLFDADRELPGFYYFTLACRAGQVWVERKIAVQIFNGELLQSGADTLEGRKRRALQYLADTEVDNVYKAAAMLATGGDRKRAGEIILEELAGIDARKDCSDFHLIVVLQILKRFGDLLEGHVLKAVRRVILYFRYWIDEPGNDVMWFFSENHALLFHICQYYAGILYPEEVFLNSGRTGREQRERAEELLEEWFGTFFGEYITEWNSNAYIPVDVLGLCGLHNLTEPGSRWHEAAKRALDVIFRDLALLAHRGAVMTTFGRSYEKENKGNYAAGTTALLYIAYNWGNLNRAALAYISFALGDYRPRTENEAFLEAGPGQALEYQKTQGYKGHVNLYLYKDRYVQLSTAVNFRPFTPGYQEHIMQATLDMTAQMYVCHPGEVQPYGNGRPNYWAGNGTLPLAAQYRNLGIMLYHLDPEHPVDFTHAYAPLMEFSAYIGGEYTVAAGKDGGYIGVRALNGLQMVESGPCRYREFKSSGRDNLWIVKTGGCDEYPSLEAFYESLDGLEVSWEPGVMAQVRDARLGCLRLTEDGLLVNGKNPYDFPAGSAGTVRWIKTDEAAAVRPSQTKTDGKGW